MANKELIASKCCESLWRLATNFESEPNLLSEMMLKQLESISGQIQKDFIEGKISEEELEHINQIFMGFMGYRGDIEEPSLGVIKQN